MTYIGYYLILCVSFYLMYYIRYMIPISNLIYTALVIAELENDFNMPLYNIITSVFVILFFPLYMFEVFTSNRDTFIDTVAKSAIIGIIDK